MRSDFNINAEILKNEFCFISRLTKIPSNVYKINYEMQLENIASCSFKSEEI